MRHAMTTAALLVAAMAAAPASAEHECTGGSVVDLAGTVYVVVWDVTAGSYLFSFFVYVESNGQAGLQRGGEDVIGYPDYCQTENPDTLVFDPTLGWP